MKDYSVELAGSDTVQLKKYLVNSIRYYFKRSAYVRNERD